MIPNFRSLSALAVLASLSAPPAAATTLIITQPAEGVTLNGTTVTVTYTTSGDLTGVDHAHFQLDANPIVMDMTFDGVHQLINVPAGSHVLNGFLVDVNHFKIEGSDATPINFTTLVADTIPPTVTMTSPTPSVTLSGTVTLSATASDNAGVLGVQFRVDGTDIVPEATTTPYTVSLNTTTFANGSHVLTAVARDAAGNLTTSDPVPVSISNSNSNDPAVVGQWSAPFAWPNVAVHMTLMSNGKILSWDDHTTGSGSNVLDTTDNSFASVPYTPSNLFCAGHANLPDGRVLVNGGHIGAYIGIAEAEFFTPSTQTWSPIAPMAYARWYPTTIPLPDGKVLTVSGAINCPDCATPGGPDAGIAEIPEIYDPATNVWTALNGAPLNLPIYPHIFVLPDGRVIATGTQEDPIATYVLDIPSQTWTTVDSAVVDGGSTVMYLPGKFMKSGSAINPDYSPLPANAATHVLDMTGGTGTWRDAAPMGFPRTQHNLTVLPDGEVLVTGGSRNSDVNDEAAAVLEAELWSPATETYRTLAAMQTPRMYHSTALLLPDGRILSAGGGRYGPSHLSGEYYSPPYLFKGPRPTITSMPTVLGYGENITVTTPDAANIATVSLIAFASVTHSINSMQRYVPLTFEAGSGALTVQTPVSRNLAPPGYYMLFLVDTSGVPSVATVVHFPVPPPDTSSPTLPTSLIASGDVGAVDLSWSASTDDVAVIAYDIHRSTTSGFTPGSGNKIGTTSFLSFRDLGLPAGTYFYKVLARDDAGNTSPPSTEQSATVAADLSAPTVPLGLATNLISTAGVELSWSPSTDNVRVAGYHVRRNGITIATTTTTHYSDMTVVASASVLYNVEAFDDAGNTSLPCPSVSATIPSVPTLASALGALFPFSEGSGPTTADLSVNGYIGSLVNSPTWTAGRYGNGLLFNASDDGNDSNDPRVTLGTAFDVPDLPITLAAWVNPSSYADYRAIFSKRDGSVAAEQRVDFGLSLGDGHVYLSGGGFSAGFTYGPPTGQWTHLAVVAEVTETRLYVDGALQEVTGAITLGPKTTANAALGGTGEPVATGDNDPFSGILDDFRLYDRALTASEIQTVMNSGGDATPPSVAITSPTGASPLSGVVTITATASDNIAVAGVSFRVGNVDLLPMATAAPYTATFNTAAFPNGIYSLHAIAQDDAGNVTTSTAVSVTVQNSVTAVASGTPPPAPRILRVYPNPFGSRATIETRGADRVFVFDVSGRLVRTWSVPGAAAVGSRIINWDGSDRYGRRLPGGVYFVKAGRLVKRVVVLR